MRCHYEVLSLENEATNEEIRKAYKQHALKWHPDKNMDNLVEAKLKFQEIKSAYDVLSDIQLRAFYDRNRDSILYAGSETSLENDTIAVYKYFNTSCYSQFDDSPKGFYTVYRSLFNEIIEKENQSSKDNTIPKIPAFGLSESSFKCVCDFYGYWQSYCTSIPFVWADEYNLAEATHRSIEKKMKKENAKLRKKARKVYNEEVRTLVEFVKKKDPRWSAYSKYMEQQRAEKRRIHEEKQQQIRNQNAQRAIEITENSAEYLKDYEEKLESLVEDLDIEDENEEYNYQCIVCEKDFKSGKSLINHEQSKKHKKKFEDLKCYMEKEDQDFFQE